MEIFWSLFFWAVFAFISAGLFRLIADPRRINVWWAMVFTWIFWVAEHLANYFFETRAGTMSLTDPYFDITKFVAQTVIYGLVFYKMQMWIRRSEEEKEKKKRVEERRKRYEKKGK